MSATYRMLKLLSQPIAEKADISAFQLVCMLMMAGCVVCSFYFTGLHYEASKMQLDAARASEQAAKEEVHRLEMVDAMRRRELDDGAKLLMQQRANLEAAQRLEKILRSDK